MGEAESREYRKGFQNTNFVDFGPKMEALEKELHEAIQKALELLSDTWGELANYLRAEYKLKEHTERSECPAEGIKDGTWYRYFMPNQKYVMREELENKPIIQLSHYPECTKAMIAKCNAK